MNKLRLYIRQSFAMMKDEKLFSGIYITGTALAITFTMIMAVSYYIMIVDTENEPIRSRTYECHELTSKNLNPNEDDTWAYVVIPGTLHSYPIREWMYSLKSAETVSAFSSVGKQYYPSPSKNEAIEVWDRKTDGNYFKMFHYNFLEGHPYSQKDVMDNNKVCVITRDLADKYFGKDIQCVGKFINIGGSYKVVGVIEPVSALSTNAYAQCFLPFENFKESIIINGQVFIATKKGYTIDDVMQELSKMSNSYNKENSSSAYKFDGDDFLRCGQFDSHQDYVINNTNNSIIRIGDLNENLLFTFFLLLIIPALNLSGLISSRMERRLPEMGVRKAFGAKKSELLNQVITENLVLTTIGGMIGLLLCWICLFLLRGKLFLLLGLTYISDNVPTLTGEMLFSPTIFALTFAFCVIINLLAGFIPAWISLSKPIVESMNHKR